MRNSLSLYVVFAAGSLALMQGWSLNAASSMVLVAQGAPQGQVAAPSEGSPPLNGPVPEMTGQPATTPSPASPPTTPWPVGATPDASTADSVESQLHGPIGAGHSATAASAKPDPLSVGTGKAPKPKDPLQAKVDMAAVTATVQALPSPPLTRIRDKEIAFVQVTLHNGSQQVAVVNGDAAQASIGTGTTPATGGRYLVQVAKPELTTQKLFAVVAADAATSALAGPIVHEFVEPSQYRKKSLGEAIGVDGTRHQVEAERFGVRVLMPGDESIGWMAFECDPEQQIKTVTIPLSFSRSLTPDGVLEVPVGSPGAAGTQTQTPSQAASAASNAMQSATQSAAISGAPKAGSGSSGFMQPPTDIVGQPPLPMGGEPVSGAPMPNSLNGPSPAQTTGGEPPSPMTGNQPPPLAPAAGNAPPAGSQTTPETPANTAP